MITLTKHRQPLTILFFQVVLQTPTNTKFTGSGYSVPTGDVKTASFYVCVDSVNTVAEVYLRGNAFARFENTPPTYTEQTKNNFPQARIRVEGRGFVFTK